MAKARLETHRTTLKSAENYDEGDIQPGKAIKIHCITNSNLLPFYKVNDRKKTPTLNLVGGADVIVSACHLLVCGAVTSAVTSGQNVSPSAERSVNWSQGHAVIADIETELDKKIEQHLDLIETLTQNLPG